MQSVMQAFVAYSYIMNQKHKDQHLVYSKSVFNICEKLIILYLSKESLNGREMMNRLIDMCGTDIKKEYEDLTALAKALKDS